MKDATPAESNVPTRLLKGRRAPPRSFLVAPDPHLYLKLIEDSVAYVLMLTQDAVVA
jgi:hypothetical protein